MKPGAAFPNEIPCLNPAPEFILELLVKCSTHRKAFCLLVLGRFLINFSAFKCLRNLAYISLAKKTHC